jgi:hypothetical protein
MDALKKHAALFIARSLPPDAARGLAALFSAFDRRGRGALTARDLAEVRRGQGEGDAGRGVREQPDRHVCRPPDTPTARQPRRPCEPPPNPGPPSRSPPAPSGPRAAGLQLHRGGARRPAGLRGEPARARRRSVRMRPSKPQTPPPVPRVRWPPGRQRRSSPRLPPPLARPRTSEARAPSACPSLSRPRCTRAGWSRRNTWWRRSRWGRGRDKGCSARECLRGPPRLPKPIHC